MYAVIQVNNAPLSFLKCVGKSKSENVAWRIALEFCKSLNGEDTEMSIEEVREQNYVLLSDGNWLEIVKI